MSNNFLSMKDIEDVIAECIYQWCKFGNEKAKAEWDRLNKAVADGTAARWIAANNAAIRQKEFQQQAAFLARLPEVPKFWGNL